MPWSYDLDQVARAAIELPPFKDLAQSCGRKGMKTGHVQNLLVYLQHKQQHKFNQSKLREAPNLSNMKTINEVHERTWFHSASVQFPPVRHHSKRKGRWVGVKGSTRNGRRDPKCPSARRLRMVRENTGASSEGATLAWMAAD
ncbi:uncharacterized protein TNCV_357351 [Trichonephila clavipes]|nr:uncharacterized protein TNCV_357351 [Trichonephila clavipes]